MRFSKQDVREMFSQDHLRNTAHALGKSATDVTADDLINHWTGHHVQMEVVHFNVESRQQGDWGCKTPISHLEPYPLPQTPPGENCDF